MKNTTRTFLYIALAYLLFFLLFTSCTEYETIHQSPCDGTCDTQYSIVYENQVISQNSSGYFEIPFNGLNYFQVVGTLTELNEQYIVNGVPLIQAKFGLPKETSVTFNKYYSTSYMYCVLTTNYLRTGHVHAGSVITDFTSVITISSKLTTNR